MLAFFKLLNFLLSFVPPLIVLFLPPSSPPSAPPSLKPALAFEAYSNGALPLTLAVCQLANTAFTHSGGHSSRALHSFALCCIALHWITSVGASSKGMRGASAVTAIRLQGALRVRCTACQGRYLQQPAHLRTSPSPPSSLPLSLPPLAACPLPPSPPASPSAALAPPRGPPPPLPRAPRAALLAAHAAGSAGPDAGGGEGGVEVCWWSRAEFACAAVRRRCISAPHWTGMAPSGTV